MHAAMNRCLSSGRSDTSFSCKRRAYLAQSTLFMLVGGGSGHHTEAESGARPEYLAWCLNVVLRDFIDRYEYRETEYNLLASGGGGFLFTPTLCSPAINGVFCIVLFK